jgi:uncharacterized protein with NRDE domain
MCLVVILRRPEHRWPLLLAANRDEMIGRPARPPGRHWPDRQEVVGGLDLLAGGSWLGVNDWGVAAAVLNRTGSLGPAPGRRSRGELVLEALDHADAVAAAAALGDLDPKAYRTFNLVIADNRDGFWLAMRGERIEAQPLKEGLSLIGPGDIDDPGAPRLVYARERFASARAPDPDRGDWAEWEALLGDPEAPVGVRPIRLPNGEGYGTTSSALVALPAPDTREGRPVFRFASWLPEPLSWQEIGVAARG